MTSYSPSLLAPPAPLDPAIPTDARVFTPQHVGVATFLGSALAGGIVMAISERREGAGKIAQHLLVSLAATAATAAIATVFPFGVLLPVAAAFGMRAYAKHAQSPTSAQLVQHGRVLGGGWAGLIGLLVMTPILVFILMSSN